MPRVKSFSRTSGNGSGSGSSRSKKIVIKPFSKPPTLPPNYYEETSRPLLEGTQAAIFGASDDTKKKRSNLGLQTSYTDVVQLVSHQFGPRLYQDLQQAFQAAAKRVLQDCNDNDEWLAQIHRQYHQYVEYLVLCKHVFLPLDRTYVWSTVTQSARKRTTTLLHQQHPQHYHSDSAANNAARSLWEVGLWEFGQRLQELQYDTRLRQAWWDALQQDWHSGGDDEDRRRRLEATLHMWQDLGWWSHIMLHQLQPSLAQFWQAQSETLQTQQPYNPSKVLQYCFFKWQHLNKWTFLPKVWLRGWMEQHLFQPQLNSEWLLKDVYLFPLLQKATLNIHQERLEQQEEDICKLWLLAGRLPGGAALVAAGIRQYALQQGLAVLNKNGKTMIGEFLQLQQHLAKLEQALPNSKEHLQLGKVWEEVLNHDSKVAEHLAKFCDATFRSAKKLEDVQLPWIISGIFCYLSAKDVFEAFYKKDLAKRLLWNRVIDMDVERRFVSLLKAECGALYTSKMEGMFQDMEWSRETMTRYKQVANHNSNNESTEDDPHIKLVDMEVQVLTTGYWPVYPQYKLNLPPSLTIPQERFSNHYKTKYQGRRMTWQYALGHCHVHGRFHKPYEFYVSLCQALVLIQFNDQPQWTLPELQAKIGLDDRDEMERVLQSLSMGKEGTRVLRKLDFDATERRKIRHAVDDRDVFRVQEKFESHQRKIRITNILWKETKEEHDKTVEAVSRDRLYLMDAVLVRILKARKTISHQQLIPQVLEQIKVPAQPADIKKRIESLIEREYMERDPKDRSRYNYLA